MGSPPRVRGKRNLLAHTAARCGITPACAGKTICSFVNPNASRDHPRVCGENGTSGTTFPYTLGSPPRVRGKLCRQNFHLFRVGITPACAGKTLKERRPNEGRGDHPRVCGENAISPRHAHRRAGSPPRVRGKPRAPLRSRVAVGITPACAGKTSEQSAFRAILRDHPRVCGENYGIDPEKIVRPGSPPRVRGKLAAGEKSLAEAGITPACAGKTRRRRLQRITTGDHPRVCGENRSPRAAKGKIRGSPPRVRGKHKGRAGRPQHRGITPACAGKTRTAHGQIESIRDHPRVCGENAPEMMACPTESGSPPRVRGKQGSHVKCGNRQGITPACAGKTQQSRA